MRAMRFASRVVAFMLAMSLICLVQYGFTSAARVDRDVGSIVLLTDDQTPMESLAQMPCTAPEIRTASLCSDVVRNMAIQQEVAVLYVTAPVKEDHPLKYLIQESIKCGTDNFGPPGFRWAAA